CHLPGAAADRPESGLMQRHVLRLGQGLEERAVLLVQPQVHRHNVMVPLWYHDAPREMWSPASNQASRGHPPPEACPLDQTRTRLAESGEAQYGLSRGPDRGARSATG